MRPVTFLKLDKWWASHYGTMLAFIYAVTAASPSPPAPAVLLATLGIFTVATLGIGTFGQLLNDLTDVEQDVRTGARNILATRGVPSRVMLMALVLVAGIVPWRWLPTTPAVAALVGLEYALLIAYSVPPLRLKERGFAGLLADALYAYAVPNAFAMLLFTNLGGGTPRVAMLTAILAWCLCFGIERILFHQLLDVTADRRGGVRTFVVRQGWDRAFGIALRVVVPAMVVSFLAMLGAWATISPVVPACFFVHALLTAWSVRGLRAGTPATPLTPIAVYHLVAERLVGTFVWRWLGPAALATLVVQRPQYLPLVPIHLALFPEPVVWLWRQAIPAAVGRLRSVLRA